MDHGPWLCVSYLNAPNTLGLQVDIISLDTDDFTNTREERNVQVVKGDILMIVGPMV